VLAFEKLHRLSTFERVRIATPSTQVNPVPASAAHFI
jgi:hypothetical protein